MCSDSRGARSTTNKRKEDTPSFTERSNDMDTCIGVASVGNAEKAGQKAEQ